MWKKYTDRIRRSLTTRIFLITAFILAAACSVTYAVLAWATPISYISVVSDKMETEMDELVSKLKETDLSSCDPLIRQFSADTGFTVTIQREDGEIVKVSDPHMEETMDLSVAQIEEESEEEGNGRYQNAVTISSDLQTQEFSFLGEENTYILTALSNVTTVDQTSEAIIRILPQLLCVILGISLMGAIVYSRYITRPIVRISQISQKMAKLDFAWKCGGKRADEIGILGRNLDELSEQLSVALHNLQEANDALKRDIDRERELERQRLTFFSAVSHELKTPVTILKGQLAGMLEGVDIYQDRDKYLAKALRTTGRMEGLIQELLTVSRMESSGFELHRQETDLCGLMRSQIALDEDLIAQKDLRQEIRMPDHAMISADPALLRKVADNLLSNAVFYAPEGGRVSVTVRSEQGQTILEIENSSLPIPEEALPHVFEAFYRVDSSRSRRTGGSGLGLYIVRMILERHRAWYKIENTEEGVRFTIRFQDFST